MNSCCRQCNGNDTGLIQWRSTVGELFADDDDEHLWSMPIGQEDGQAVYCHIFFCPFCGRRLVLQ